MACLFASPVAAQQKRSGTVLVLQADDQASWEQGVQALVAELITTGYELNVRAAHAHLLDPLERELQTAVAGSEALAGVSIAREGDNATALLCRRGASPCERLRMNISEGELSRSRLALAVVERLRPIDLPVAPEPAKPPPPVAPEIKPSAAAPPAAHRVHLFRTWLSGGAVLASGMSAPLVWLTGSLELVRVKPWGLELCVAGSPLAGKVETSAGSLALRGLSVTAFATFEPVARPPLGFSLGLGAGVLHLQETAAPAPGYDVASDSPTVGLVSARARLSHQMGPAYFGLTIEPGMLIPAVKVEAAAEAVRIGRPWVSLQASMGLDL